MSYTVSFKAKVYGDDLYYDIISDVANTTWNVRDLIILSTGLPWKNMENNGLCKDVIPFIKKGINELLYFPDKYKKYEDENGWGTVESTAKFFNDILSAWIYLEKLQNQFLLDNVTFWIE